MAGSTTVGYTDTNVSLTTLEEVRYCMPRPCTICHHPQREAIEQTLLTSASYRDIALQFGVSHMAVSRHKQDHLPQHLCQAHAAQEVSQADTLLAQLQTLTGETQAILREARTGATKDPELALKAIARLEKQLELQARLLGELKDGTTVNLLVLPAWQELRTTILLALVPYPEARAAVATALLHGSPDVHPNGTGA